MSRTIGAKDKTTDRLDAIIACVAGDDEAARLMLKRTFAYAAKKPPSFWRKVAKTAEAVMAQIEGEDVAYVIRLHNSRDNRCAMVSSAQATCMIATGEFPLATRAEVLDFKAEEQVARRAIEVVAPALASRATDGGAR